MLALFGVLASAFTFWVWVCDAFIWCIIPHLFVQHAQWNHHLMFVMIRDGLFNSTSPHVGIHLRPLSGVNGVFARLALKVFEDTRSYVMCIQPPALLLLIDLFALWLFLFLSILSYFSQIWINFWMNYRVSYFCVCFRGFHYTSLHPSNGRDAFPLLLYFSLSNEMERIVL